MTNVSRSRRPGAWIAPLLALAVTAASPVGARADDTGKSDLWRGLNGAKVQQEAGAVLEAWLAAQNANDYKAYAALYSAEHFRGVKRTSDGTVKRYDHGAWLKDRKAMFSKHLRVAADDVWIESWLDPGSKLKAGVTAIHFLQRWKSKSYADRGDKVLQLWRNASGKQEILYEDMLNSAAGWDEEDAKRIAREKAKADESETKDAATVLQRLTVENYLARLEDLEAEEAHAVAMTILREHDFACDQAVTYDECGDVHSEWESLEPTLGIESPCLKRLVGVWSLEGLLVEEADVRELADGLVTVFALDPPEQELPQRLLELVETMDASLRVRFIVAAVDSPAELLIDLGGLSDDALEAIVDQTSYAPALQALAPEVHTQRYLDALAARSLPRDVLQSLVSAVSDVEGAAVTESLREVAENAEPTVANAAVEALIQRGVLSSPPQHDPNADLATTMLALQLVTLRDADEETVRGFVGADGVEYDVKTDLGFPELDDDGNPIEVDETPTQLPWSAIGAGDLPPIYEAAASCPSSPTPSLGETATCEVDVGSDNYALTWTYGGPRLGWKLILVAGYEWRGCPC